MPELPEVETVCQGLNQLTLNQEIWGGDVLLTRTIAYPFSVGEFLASLKNVSITRWHRRGKYLLAELTHSDTRNQEGVRSQESGVRSQESGVRSQESGVRSQELGEHRKASTFIRGKIIQNPKPARRTLAPRDEVQSLGGKIQNQLMRVGWVSTCA